MAATIFHSHRFPPVTTTFIVICLAVSLFSRLGEAANIVLPLLIDDPRTYGFDVFSSSQYWRLVTPIFVHFGLLHIAFNMLWLWDLGATLERKHGHLFLMAFVLSVGIISNLGQYVLGQSAYFGGMSGVVYGLLGYMWIVSWRMPELGLVLHKQVVVMMFIWFIVCWLGVVGAIANWAHTFGLVMGVAIGYLNVLRLKK